MASGSLFDRLCETPAATSPGNAHDLRPKAAQNGAAELRQQLGRLLSTRRTPFPASGNSPATSLWTHDRLLTYGLDQPLRNSVNESDDVQNLEELVRSCIARHMGTLRDLKVATDKSSGAPGRTIIPVNVRVRTAQQGVSLDLNLDRLSRDVEVAPEQSAARQ